MLASWNRYLWTESLISALINAAISLGFVFVAFHGTAHVPSTGAGSLLRDAAPQSFMVALMAALVPCLLTRKRWQKGGLPLRVGPSNLSPKHWLLFSLAFAALALAFSMAIQAWVWMRLLPSGLSFRQVIVVKVIYGAVLGAVVTALALRRQWRIEGE